MPSGLTSTSPGSTGACSRAAVSGANADVPRPWYDCVQSIGAPLLSVSTAGWEEDGVGGTSGSGVPETAGTRVRGAVAAEVEVVEVEVVVVVGLVEGGGCVVVFEVEGEYREAVEGCTYCFGLEALTRVRTGHWTQLWGIFDACSRLEAARSGINVRGAIAILKILMLIYCVRVARYNTDFSKWEKL